MIRRLSGTLVQRGKDEVVLSCAGIGFLVSIPSTTPLPAVGGELTLWTHLRLREDAADLFGFATLEEHLLFESMQKIRGFPARTALSVLSHFGVDGFRQVIIRGEVKPLTEVPGVGKKLAQQLLLDMRGAIDLEELKTPASSKPQDDAVLALMELGYRENEATERVARVRGENKGVKDLAQLVKLALRS